MSRYKGSLDGLPNAIPNEMRGLKTTAKTLYFWPFLAKPRYSATYLIVAIMLKILYDVMLQTFKNPANAHMEARTALRGTLDLFCFKMVPRLSKMS